jgi:ADP-heptose:LPS heptosyltransferase
VSTLSFRKIRETQRLSEWKAAQLAQRPYAVVNPGGRLGVRRVPVEVFVRAASLLSEKGMVPVVTWGPNEEALAQEVVKYVAGALHAPSTNIDELAGLMRDAQLTVCNNTGPMHLSVAVGTPTFALFLRMPMNRWGHFYGPHRMLDLTPALENDVPLTRLLEEELHLWLGTNHHSL